MIMRVSCPPCAPNPDDWFQKSCPDMSEARFSVVAATSRATCFSGHAPDARQYGSRNDEVIHISQHVGFRVGFRTLGIRGLGLRVYGRR